MRRRACGAALSAVCAALAIAGPAQAAGKDPINGYRVDATQENLRTLAAAGFDVTEGTRGKKVEIYGTRSQIAKLASAGVRARLVRDAKGRSSSQRSARAAQATDGDAAFSVWRRYDRVEEPAGSEKEQYLELYDRLLAERANITKRVVLGKTYQGRDIIALKVTRNARSTPDNSRPAVLYNALQHAREWLAGETCRRTLLHFTENYGEDAEVTRLVNTRELWFVCVANPDGYEYTFTPGNRLWRKNMADNDNDGVRGEVGDGVDPNRNFPDHWGLDDEGSSPDPASETYRGPGPASEPETKAMLSLFDRVDFKFQSNDHTAANLILYPEGWQQYTPTADNPIFEALAGTDDRPAIPTFDPDLGAELYITNGDTLDTAYHEHDILAFTPEGTVSPLEGVTGFEFPDDEEQIEAEWQRHKQFKLDLARSAPRPDDPRSHLGNDVEDFYVDDFADSYGSPQTVEVIARRALGAVRLKYRINDGRTRDAGTREFQGGERYKRDDQVYYRRLRGTVRNISAGDEVEVWFETARTGRRSDEFTFTVRNVSNDRVLVLANEDYTGPTPAQDGGPNYVGYYTNALEANGVGYDVYDVDARDRRSPHPLGVLSHYDAVIWYTGDDYLTREPGQPAGTGTARSATDTMLAVRDYLNEGGKLLYTGKNAGRQFVEGFPFRNYGFPEPGEGEGGRWCDAVTPNNEAEDRCVDHNDDFLQYWLGAYIYVGDGGTRAEGGLNGGFGDGDPFGPLTWSFGDEGAGNQDHSAAFVPTSAVLDPERYPWYGDSRLIGRWAGAEAPYEPLTGDWFVAAGTDDEAYKRLTRTIDLTGKTAAELSFNASFDLEDGWDYLFVEAHEVGTDAWTTLPDANGHTSQDTGSSCPTQSPFSNWQELHPFLARYQTITGPTTCVPTGTTGEWNGATGNSNGWQQFRFDLSRYAGKQVEVSITVASDPATLGLGAWIDDAKVTADGETVAETSFEEDLGGWTSGPAPEGTEKQVEGWARTNQGLPVGSVVATEDTVYTGFGFEGIDGEDTRAQFLNGVLRHLGVLPGGRR